MLLNNTNRLFFRFVNIIMRRGKKNLAISLFSNALLDLKGKKLNPYFIIRKAISNAKPVLYYRLQKRGARVIKLPQGIKVNKSFFLCFKWLIDGAKSKLHSTVLNSFSKKLSSELIDASKGNGNALKKKTELYDILLENRTYLKHR
jgi:small subunit ribosomal protein S7